MGSMRNKAYLAGMVGTGLLLFGCFVGKSQPSGDQQSVLRVVQDVELPGPAVRFDYQSYDPDNGMLYIAHMNADHVVVFDTAKRQVIANLDGFHRVHGIISVPELDRVYASVTGDHQVFVVDRSSLRTIAKAGSIRYPDGLAYAPKVKRLFVSDEHGDADAVIDATTNTQLKLIPLAGGAGNTVYDEGSGDILVGVHGANELVTIDPENLEIRRHLPLPGISNPHGIALDEEDRLAFVAGEGNSRLAVVDLRDWRITSSYRVGRDPDVLAYDPAAKRLYVSAESGQVTVFQVSDRKLLLQGQIDMPHAHTVSLDPKTHLVYFPLENVNGKPLLRIMEWVGDDRR
jgi:DNA-binding beta-propeller fold protein YncE